jgi:D-glucosaminate-6-phosphate ammonia-lyase
MPDLHDRYNLTRVINLSGPLTVYGTGQTSKPVAEMAAEALQHEWMISELADRASEVIAQWSGTDAGTLTASTASGVALTSAACMSGADMGRVRQLPDTTGMKNEIVIQHGHCVQFGAPIEQMIRLSGAKVRTIGTVNQTTVSDLTHALNENTAAAMFVISHHTVQHGFVQLQEFVDICHGHGVPVIIDGAAQAHQIDRMVASGADLIIVSGQKYLDAPTSGIVCGRGDLVEAVAMQNSGIGRAMKVGKEGMIGTIAALEERLSTDLEAWSANQRGRAEYLASQLSDAPHAEISLVPDQTGQPITRVRVDIDEARSPLSAEEVCIQLEQGDPTIRPRAHHTDEGWFFLEPNHASQADLDIAAKRLIAILAGNVVPTSD